jgi:N-terminal domain of galactosyltransferase
VDTQLYHHLRGHDEGFEGWGREDREFWNRIANVTPVVTRPGRLLHLFHSRGAEAESAARANLERYRQLQAGVATRSREPIGNLDCYRRLARAAPVVGRSG